MTKSGLIEAVAGEPSKSNALFCNVPAVAARVLAFARAERRQKFIERGVAAVLPMKLAILAQLHTCIREH